MSELENEFGDQVRARNLNATSEENAPLMEPLGFNNHGLVIRSAEGEDLWSQPDHDVNMDDVRAKIRELIG